MSAAERSKKYIGDGVYAEVRDGMLRITTENGIEETNVVWFDPVIWLTLKDWVGSWPR